MVKRKFWGMLLGIGLLLAGCEFFGGSGGGSSSETESTVAGQVRYADNRPVVDAKVTMVTASASGDTLSLGETGLRETVTDTFGRFSFGALPTGLFRLEARMDGDGFSQSNAINISVPEKPEHILLPPQTLTQSQGIEGSLINLVGEGVRANISLYGSNRKTVTDSLGKFSLLNLAEGIHILRITPVTSTLGSLELATRAGGNLGKLSLSGNNAIHVSDFEDPFLETPFSPVFGKGYWYAQDDHAEGGSSTFSPMTIQQNFSSALTDSGAWQGKSLHVEFKVNNARAESYALVSFSVGGSRLGYNFSALDSLVFMAKGTGSIRFEFQTFPVINQFKDWRHFKKNVALTSTWTRISIPKTDLLLAIDSPARKAGLDWAIAGKQVVNVVFVANDPADFWLDDLVFYGMTIRGM
jgi:hypothetical protein